MIYGERRLVLQKYLRLSTQALGKERIALRALPAVFTRDMRHAAGHTEPGESTHKDPQLEYVKSIIRFVVERYGLKRPRIVVKFSHLPSDGAGHVFARNGTWFIEIDRHHRNSKVALHAIVAHEVAHILLGLCSVSTEPTRANEELTDAVAVLAGFGKSLHQACLQEYIGRGQRTIIELGYLNREDIAYLARLQMLIHAQRPVRRWCPVTLAPGYCIHCYACGSGLKAAPSSGTFKVRCTQCGMRQIVTFRLHRHSMPRWQRVHRKLLDAVLLWMDSLRGFDIPVIPGTYEQERKTASASETASSQPRHTSQSTMPAWWGRPRMLVAAVIVLVLGGIGAAALFQQRTHAQYKAIVQGYKAGFRQVLAALNGSPPDTSPPIVTPPARSTGGPKANPIPSSSPVPPASVSLPTGTELTPGPWRHGLGTLTAMNGNAVDAVVKLVEEMEPRVISRAVYIRAYETATIKNIASGRYILQFALGENWDRLTRQFARVQAQKEFVDPFDFQEHQEGDRIYYNTPQVTLHRVRPGNAETRPPSPSEWPREEEGTGWPVPAGPGQNRSY